MAIENVKFRGRHVFPRALIFLITGVLTVVAYIVIAVLTVSRGGTDTTMGVLATVSALVSLIGLIASIRAMEERDIFLSVPIAGMVVNGISFLIYVVTYIVGLA